MGKSGVIASLAILLFLSAPMFCPAAGQDSLGEVLSGFGDTVSTTDTSLDEALSGFDDLGAEGEATMPAPLSDAEQAVERSLPSWLDFSGSISQSASYNYAHKAPDPGKTDQRGFSRLRSAIALNSEIELPDKWQARMDGKAFYDAAYSQRGRSQFPQELLDAYESEVEIGEMFLQGSLLPDLDVKLGRQIVVWGKSDNIRVTDLLNPLDNREPGMIDIKDLRLPVAMTRLDYYTRRWNLSGIVIHEFRPNKEPVFGSDFFGGSTPAPEEEKPTVAWQNQEYGLAANGIFSGWDISFYGAWLWNDQTHQENTSNGIRRRHARLGMLGTSLNIARGNWLLKGEAAYLDGLKYSIDVGKKERLDILAGLEYTGFSETVISFEVVNRHIFSFDDRLRDAPVYGQKNEVQHVLRLNRDFLHDTVQLSLVLSTFDHTGDDGAFQRFSLKYDWSDSVNLSAGVIQYDTGNNALFRNIGENDRIFTEIRYSF